MVDDGRTTDGRTPDHGHPISSPCEPDGSGELKMCSEMVENRPKSAECALSMVILGVATPVG